MELLIIPLFIWAVKLFVRLVQFLFRVVCYMLGCISLGIDTARSRSEQRKRAELKQKELDWKMQIEQAKQEQRERDSMARIEREKTRAERDAIRWEWAVQKEADRRAELEWKRKRREQIEKEKESNNKKAEAGKDIERYKDILKQNVKLYGMLYNEYEQATENKNSKKAIVVYRQMIAADKASRDMERKIEKAKQIIDDMPAEQVKAYLKQLLEDNIVVGVEIIKGKG